MRIVAISDTHGRHKKLRHMPEGDVLVCAGDSTPCGELDMFCSFVKWMADLDYKIKILVAGNHDWCFQNEHSYLAKKECQEHGLHYLEDRDIQVGGLKFYGSPWQPEFWGLAFNLPRGERLKRVWDAIPEHTDVLITHGPPAGILDYIPWDKEHTGCHDLYEAVINRIQPKVHIFGHIHCAHGRLEAGGTTFVNACIVGEDYHKKWEPTVIDLPHEGEIEREI